MGSSPCWTDLLEFLEALTPSVAVEPADVAIFLQSYRDKFLNLLRYKASTGTDSSGQPAASSGPGVFMRQNHQRSSAAPAAAVAWVAGGHGFNLRQALTEAAGLLGWAG